MKNKESKTATFEKDYIRYSQPQRKRFMKKKELEIKYNALLIEHMIKTTDCHEAEKDAVKLKEENERLKNVILEMTLEKYPF